MAEGRAALENGELPLAASKFRQPSSSSRIGSTPTSGDALAKQGDAQAPGRLPKGRRTEPADLSAKASQRCCGAVRLDRRDCGGRSRDGQPRRRHSPGEVQGSRAAARRVRQGAAVDRRGAGMRSATASSRSRRSASRSRRWRSRCELDIRNAEAHKILGRNLMIIGRFDAAQVEFEQAPALQAGFRRSSTTTSASCSRSRTTGSPRGSAFEAALRLDPAYVEAIDALGFALEALGDDAGAVAGVREGGRVERGAARARSPRRTST